MRSLIRLADLSSENFLGTVLIGVGLTLLVYAAGMQLDVVPGGRVAVPRPPALDRPRPVPVDGGGVIESFTVPASETTGDPADPTAAVIAGPSAASADENRYSLAVSDPDALVAIVEPPEARPDPAVFANPLLPADAVDRPFWGSRPPPGRAVHLRIPSIKLKTDVVSAGVVQAAKGDLEWETVPFVAAHYRETSQVGARGNAVISGHVVTLSEGNVFRNLYQIDFGSTIEVDTEEGTFTYRVEEIRLVVPSAVEVMASSDQSRLTLITCGGEFNPRTREFSDRLIVTGVLADWSRHPAG